MRRCDRRLFLVAGVTGAASMLAPRFGLHGEEAANRPAADALVSGKSSRLLVHNQKTLEIETPLELLREHRLTPIDMLFVRNNQQPTWSLTLDPAKAENWTLEIAGLVEYPKTIPLKELLQLPSIEQELVLQCSGNGRAFFSRSATAKGSQWQHGAMANVQFKGVPLKAVLEKFAVNPHPAVRFLTAEGRDDPAAPVDADFEHSIPITDALDRSILAFELNGTPLPAIHGGPLRLITPGYYGTMNVKWLSRLRLEAQETANHHQVKRYRTPLQPIEPGAKFEYSLDNSEPNWNMRIKSVIFSPLEGEQVKAGRVSCNGVAWNDGKSRIEAVELSLDGGRHWERAELEVPASPYAWYPWQKEVAFTSGKQTLLCRAIDTLGRTQPMDGSIDWNPAGYGWRGIHGVAFTVD